MLGRWRRRLVLALKEASLGEATRRAAGGSGTKLGMWMAAVALAALLAASWGGEAWKDETAALLAIMGACAWRSKRRDDLDWDSQEKARENERRAWLEAREAAAKSEAADIAAECPKAKRRSEGVKRL